MAENATNQDEHDDEHVEKPSYDDINVPVVVMVAFLSIILTVLSIAFVQGIYNHWRASFVEQRQYSVSDERRDTLIERQRDKLEPADNGRVSIDKAMQQTLEEYRN